MRRHNLVLALAAGWAGLLSGLMPLFAPTARALPILTGCYLHTNTWERRDCKDIQVAYPSFRPAADECYFSWWTGAITPPTKIRCFDAPNPDAPVQYPQNFTPGAAPKPVVPAGCTGSPLGAGGDKNACNGEPLGCPGSPLVGQPSATFNPATCKYSPVVSNVPPPSAPAPAPGSATPASSDDAIDPDRATAINCSGADVNNGKSKINPTKLTQCFRTNPLVHRFRDLINFLGAGVGVIVVIMIMIGGLQYMSAGNNPQAVTTAKKRIVGAVLALLAYTFLWAFMQWLVPGGVF